MINSEITEFEYSNSDDLKRDRNGSHVATGYILSKYIEWFIRQKVTHVIQVFLLCRIRNLYESKLELKNY